MQSSMLRSDAVPSRILCRVDVEDTVWILIKYETAKETSWLKFRGVKEMQAYVSQPQVNLECPQRRLTSEEANKLVGDERRKMQIKLLALEEKLKRYESLLGEGSKASTSLHTSPAVRTSTASLANRVTTGTAQSSGGSSAGPGMVRPIETRHGANFPANLGNKFEKVSGLKRSASALVPGSGSSGSGLGSGNNSEAEGRVNKQARPALLRTASLASMNSTTSIAPVSNKQDLRSMLRARQSRVPSLSSLAPDESEADLLNTATGTANSSLNNTPREASAIKSEDEGSYYWTESEGSTCEQHRHKDLEGGMSTDDAGYNSEHSTTSHGSTFAASTLPATGSSNDGKANNATSKRSGIAMKDESSRDFIESGAADGLGRGVSALTSNKHALRRSQSVESNNSVNSNHSATSNQSNQSNKSMQSNTSQNSRASRRSAASASHAASSAQNLNTTSNSNFNTNFNGNIEDDSRCSMRFSQDDEESRSLLFAGLQDQSRTFNYPGKNANLNSSTTLPTMNGGTGGSLFGMVMSYASNYVANFLSPSQRERERQQREQQASQRQAATSASAHTNDSMVESAMQDAELSQSSQARSNDSFTMLEYTRDAPPSSYSSSNTANTNSNLPVANADLSTAPSLVFDPTRMEEDGDTQESAIVASIAAEEEEVAASMVPVDWTRISVETQNSLPVFIDAIKKAKLPSALESTLLRGIVTKEINPIDCGRLLSSNLRAGNLPAKSATAASLKILAKAQFKVLAKLTKLLQKLSMRNKNIPTSNAINVKAVCACCVIQVSLQMNYFHRSGETERKEDKKNYSETVSDTLDRLVFVLNAPDVSNDDAAWLLAFADSAKTQSAPQLRVDNASTSTNDATFGSPSEQVKPRIEVLIEYLKEKFFDSVIWPDVQDAVLRYDSTYRRNFISPVKQTPASVKKAKKATAQKAITELAISGNLFDILEPAAVVPGADQTGPSVVNSQSLALPPLRRTDRADSIASSDKKTTVESAPVVVPLKRTNSVLSGLLLKQVQAKTRGSSTESAAASTTASDAASAAAESSEANAPAAAANGKVKRLLLERKTRPTHRDMMEQKTVTVSHKPSTKPAFAAAPVVLPPPPKPAPATSLFMASEFAKTPNKTRMISFGAHHGLGGHATPISSQMDYDDFLFSSQRSSQRSVLRSTSARRSTVVENTPMESLHARRSSATSSSALADRGHNSRYFAGGVGYLSSPSPEGASARRKSRTHSHGDLGEHADSAVPHSAGSRSSTSSGGSGGRAGRYTNRLSNLFVTQDDNDEDDQVELEDEPDQQARNGYQGQTSRLGEVRAAGAFSDFFSTQEPHTGGAAGNSLLEDDDDL